MHEQNPATNVSLYSRKKKKTNDSDIDTWYAGILRGLSNALELVGMIGKENNKQKKITDI